MNKIEKILRTQTVNLFNDKWYEETCKKIIDEKNNTFGYVYFIKSKSNNLIKIGKSINLNSRLSTLKTGMSDGLFLIGLIYTEKFNSKEVELHRKFNDFRVQGEWFKLDEKKIIEQLNFSNGLLVNKYYVKKSKVVEGIAYDFEKYNINEFDDFFIKVYNYFEELKFNTKIYHEDLRINVKKLDKTYESLSSRKITILLKKWCKQKEIEYKYFFSTPSTFFILKK